MQRSKVPLKLRGQSKRTRCKAELVQVTSQISVGIAPPYLTRVATTCTQPYMFLIKYNCVTFLVHVPLTFKLLANCIRNSFSLRNIPTSVADLVARFSMPFVTGFKAQLVSLICSVKVCTNQRSLFLHCTHLCAL